MVNGQFKHPLIISLRKNEISHLIEAIEKKRGVAGDNTWSNLDIDENEEKNSWN